MNKILLTGRLTRELELRYTQSNIAVCQFSLAVNRNFKNANGEYDADFPTCIAFRKTAEMMKEYLHKGDKIEIEGRLQTRSYDAKDGSKRYVQEVIVEHLGFLESRKESKEDTTSDATDLRDPYDDLDKDIALSDDDLPF